MFHAPCAQTGALQDRSRPTGGLRRLIHARLRGRAYRSGSENRVALLFATFKGYLNGLRHQTQCVMAGEREGKCAGLDGRGRRTP